MLGNFDNELKYLQEEANRAHESIDEWLDALADLRAFQKKHGLIEYKVNVIPRKPVDRSWLDKRAQELGFSKK